VNLIPRLPSLVRNARKRSSVANILRIVRGGRNEFGYWLAVACDQDALAKLNTREQLGQMRFRFVNTDFFHDRLCSDWSSVQTRD